MRKKSLLQQLDNESARHHYEWKDANRQWKQAIEAARAGGKLQMQAFNN